MLISKKSKIFIAGHNGMVGSAIQRSLQQKGYQNILCTPRNDLNLLNFEEVNNWFNKNRPEVVILAAAKVGGIYANSNYSFDFILENLKIPSFKTFIMVERAPILTMATTSSSDDDSAPTSTESCICSISSSESTSPI